MTDIETSRSLLRAKLQSFIAEADDKERAAKAEMKRKGNSAWNKAVARDEINKCRFTRASATAALARLDEVENAA